MLAVIVRRTFGAAATFLAATFVVFMVTFALPGYLVGDGGPSPGVREHAEPRSESATTSTIHCRPVRRMARASCGRLGESFVLRRPVSEVMLDALPVTLTLLALTIAIEVVFGLLIGASALLDQVDRSTTASRGVHVGHRHAGLHARFDREDVLGVRVGILPVAGTSAGLQATCFRRWCWRSRAWRWRPGSFG